MLVLNSPVVGIPVAGRHLGGGMHLGHRKRHAVRPITSKQLTRRRCKQRDRKAEGEREGGRGDMGIKCRCVTAVVVGSV